MSIKRTAHLLLPLTVLASSVVAPSPAGTTDVEGWRSDIDSIAREIASTHPHPWHRITADEFATHVEKLKAEVPTLDEEEIIVRAMQLVALVHDGHTMLRPVNHPAFTLWFPLRFDQFADGIFITAIDKKYAELVGARVLRFGNLTAQDAFQRVGSVAFMDSRHSIPKEVPGYISNATILTVLKIIETPHALPLELELPSGKKQNVSIPSAEWRAVFGWTRQNYGIPGSGDFVNVFSDKMDRLPLHLKNLLTEADFYWFKLVPLNWFSDWKQVVLPHSGLNLWVSTLYWQRGEPSDDRGYYPPDFSVPVTSRDFFSGNDKALEAILSGKVVTLADVPRGDNSPPPS